MPDRIGILNASKLALNAYSENVANSETVEGYRVVEQREDASGFSATVYTDDSGQVYMSIRGTEKSDSRDYAADYSLYKNELPIDQYTSAVRMLADVSEASGQQVTIIGHSLGGALAQMCVATHPEYVKEVVRLCSR